MASPLEFSLSLPRKRLRLESQETCSRLASFDDENLSFKRLNASLRPASSHSSQSSCVSACDAVFTPQTAGLDCVEAAVTSESLVDLEWGTESVEEADSSNGSSLVSLEGESKNGATVENCRLDHSLTACTSQDQKKLRRTVSEAAESSSGEDAQVDIDCFLKDWDEDVDGLGFNPADVFSNKLLTDSEESFDSAFTPDSDDLGISVAPIDSENWFLSDLGCDGQIYWNEAQDQEWMTTAVANLDRINDAFATDASMLQLLEAGPGI